MRKETIKAKSFTGLPFSFSVLLCSSFKSVSEISVGDNPSLSLNNCSPGQKRQLPVKTTDHPPAVV
jgi:hypothetical protein